MQFKTYKNDYHTAPNYDKQIRLLN